MKRRKKYCPNQTASLTRLLVELNPSGAYWRHATDLRDRSRLPDADPQTAIAALKAAKKRQEVTA